MRWFAYLGVLVIGSLATPLLAQSTLDYPVGERQPYHYDSGFRPNRGEVTNVVSEHLVQVDGAAWLRLYFGDVELEPGSFVRITSQLDNEIQELDARGLAMWSNTSAYFNGDAVFIELVAGPKSTRNRLVIEEVAREMAVHPVVQGCAFPCGICGADNRVISNENWSGRLFPVGCSASVWNEQSCLVSAGHCVAGGGATVVQFNVPASNGDCSTNNPPVADQFPITSFLFQNGGIGDDWSVLTTGTNNLGQTIFGRYGLLRPIASTPPFGGQVVGVWGFGIDNQCTLSQRQQTSTGSVQGIRGTWFEHSVDITCGSSGSGVIRSGEILGIVTHCPCPGAATRVDHPGFVAARENLCPPPPASDDCASRIVIDLGNTAFTTIAATTDGAVTPGDCGPFGDEQVYNDVWYNYNADFTGTLQITTCEQLGGSANYNTRIAAYESCGCPASNATFLGCNDEDPVNACGEAGGGFHSTLEIPVTAGNCYKIRVGGFNTADAGSGVLHLEGQPATGACCLFPGPNCDDGVSEAACTGAGGVYQGDGTDCGTPCRECASDGDCDDGDPCTLDSCDAGVCVNTPITPCCGNGVADPGEDCQNCPADVQCPPGDECIAGICERLCGNGVVDPGEDCSNCPADVQCPPGDECIAGICERLCGNGVVDPGEDCSNCPADVQCPPGTECIVGVCQPLCGNGVPDPGEDCSNCPEDVQCPPGTECIAGICEPLCGNGVVDPGEDCATCPADVPCSPGDECIAGICERLCGNGAVDPGEDCSNCPEDVQCPPDDVCVGGICETPRSSDLNGDGCTDSKDLTILLGFWCSPAGDDPDPPGDVDPPCEGCLPGFAVADIAGPGGSPLPDGCCDSNDLTKLLGDWCSAIGNPCGTCGP
ncbi:MAG: hypothetical protein IH889_06075 [Planctomycetes bacterium]|nr:hypothetical protein [Planctomycetota bacterium]